MISHPTDKTRLTEMHRVELGLCIEAEKVLYAGMKAENRAEELGNRPPEFTMKDFRKCASALTGLAVEAKRTGIAITKALEKIK